MYFRLNFKQYLKFDAQSVTYILLALRMINDEDSTYH